MTGEKTRIVNESTGAQSQPISSAFFTATVRDRRAPSDCVASPHFLPCLRSVPAVRSRSHVHQLFRYARKRVVPRGIDQHMACSGSISHFRYHRRIFVAESHSRETSGIQVGAPGTTPSLHLFLYCSDRLSALYDVPRREPRLHADSRALVVRMEPCGVFPPRRSVASLPEASTR